MGVIALATIVYIFTDERAMAKPSARWEIAMRLKRYSFAVVVAGLSVSAALLQPTCAFAVDAHVQGETVSSATSVAEAESLVAGETEQGALTSEQTADQTDSEPDAEGTPETSDGWVDIEGGKQYWRDDAPLKDEWLELNGARYRFSSDGFMLTGFQDIDGARYYFAPDAGAMQTGWRLIDGAWYWFDTTSGAMAVNQAFAEGRWSRFDGQGMWLGYTDGWVLNGTDWYWTSAGVSQTGWRWVNGAWYWLSPSDGKMATGWIWDGGAWYYMSPSGAMLTGWQYVDGHWYYLRSNGAMATGWLYEGGIWYWLGGSGAAAQNEVARVGSESYVFNASCNMGSSGWCLVNGNWYLASSSGALQSGWRWVNGAWYWMGWSDYAMRTGVLSLGGSKYYLTPSGAMATGWAWDDGDQCWYYATPNSNDGRLLTGWRFIGGSWYWMDPATAKMLTGWLDFQDGSYYLSGSGAMLSSSLLDANGSKYWLDGSGLCVSGWADTSSGRFYFDPSAAGSEAVGTRHPAKLGRVEIDGKTYQIDANSGLLRNTWVGNEDGSQNWAESDGSLSALTLRDGVLTLSDGSLASGWLDLGGSRFYADAEGRLCSGWASIDGQRYYFDPTTYAMKTGWLADEESWYWLRRDGAMATGWVNIPGDAWYYLNADGAMKTGWFEEGGKHYYLDPSGRMATGVRYIDGVRRVFWTNGECDKIGWQNAPQYPQVSSWNVTLPRYSSGKFAYATPSRISVDATREDCINAFVGRAYEYLGSPYIWDYACAPGVGVDCAGLVLQCLYACGVDTFPMSPYDHYYTPGHDHYANDLWNNSSFLHLDYSQVQRGDIVCYPGHVAIYVGNNQIIEAASPRYGVRLISASYRKDIRGVLRPFV